MARIAIIGWGSLIWDQRELPTKGSWTENGPILPLEFSRRSSDGRLTLVIDTQHGRDASTRYAESNRDELENAVCDLMHREGTSRKNIGVVDCRARPDQALTNELRIWEWAVANNFDFAIWTTLSPRVPNDWGGFSVHRAEAYLRDLPKICKEHARRYILNAPPEVQTPLREHLRAWLEEK